MSGLENLKMVVSKYQRKSADSAGKEFPTESAE
jgi:hypothetical protein